ncbi:2Fe-2S iron-sulfur cluster-binding protein [Methanoplanus endosymbiosus]|uniref:2Fe-2S iron-sulfur cluster-binding protein n=1 Tax=Methanoplanus endosymbiosus TaxID=33865 RepID=A0A9E7TLE0_9EURY|nr:2Fe-2S iron-sulfur cluster-binding protein [Methanoplanus endosymbiosus]UUX93645.1 2Fe-2S iron-sulfur cluster-binding protein [Methanoplanus endosymbiosus]
MTDNTVCSTEELLKKSSEDVTVIINGREYPAKKGEVMLGVAIREGIEIPHLCYEASLSPYGACRLCMVEKRCRDRSEMVTSCTLRAEDGLEVVTDSPEILRHRRMILELYLAEAPKSEVIKSLAARYGVTKTRFFKKTDKDDPLGNKCILCGLCVRVCNEIIGAGVISFVNRGPYTVVSTPFSGENSDCLGCKACVSVCPTHAIVTGDSGDERIMKSWGETKVKMRECPVCGNYYLPDLLAEKVYAKINPPLSKNIQEMCPKCRSRNIAIKEISASSNRR